MPENNRPDYRAVAEFYRENHRGERQRGMQEVGAAWIGETKDGVQSLRRGCRWDSSGMSC